MIQPFEKNVVPNQTSFICKIAKVFRTSFTKVVGSLNLKREQRKDEALLASLGVATDVETLIVN